jgi:protein ImuB
MLLADAESLWPKAGAVRFEPTDALADRQRLREMAVVCQQFSPTVALEATESPEAVLLDATGCGFGFDGEGRFAGDVVAAIRERGFWAIGALADTVGAAWAVARHAASRRLLALDARERVLVVPPGEHSRALRPLPIESLRLSAHTVEVLHELNVVRVDQLLAIPRDQLPSRFGAEVLTCIDRALGVIPEGLRAERAIEPLEARWSFESPVENAQVLMTVIDELLGRLLKEIRGQDVGFQKLLWWLRMEGHDQVCLPIELLRPTTARADLLELIRLQMERLRLPGAVTDVTVRAALIVPLVYRQVDLFGGRIGSTSDEDVTGLIERLSSRLGNAAVLRPRLVPDAQPELAYQYDPWLAVPTRKPSDNRDPACLTRPALLKERLEPIVVMSAPGGSPAWLKWDDREYAIERSWGPERIETGWWRGRDVRRDYFMVETTDGERFWLYRDLTAGQWYMHGSFA